MSILGDLRNESGLFFPPVSRGILIFSAITIIFNSLLNHQRKPNEVAINTEPKDLILIIDIGSSSIRCTPFEFPTNIMLEHASSRSSMAIIGAGKTETVERICAAIEDNMMKCIMQLRCLLHQFRVVAIGFSTLSMCIYGVNEANFPVTKIMSYACSAQDSPAILRAIQQLSGQCDRMNHHDETGTILNHPAYAAVQLRAVMNENQNRPSTDKLMIGRLQTIAQRLVGIWSGETIETPMSICEASWTGLLSLRTATWYRKPLEIRGGRAVILPDLRHFDEFYLPYNNLSSSLLSKDDKELHQAHLFLGMADGACATIGSHCMCPHRVSVTIGTSSAVRVAVPASNEASIPFGLWCYRISKQYLLVGGALNDGGNLIEWFQTFLGSKSRFDRNLRQLDAIYQSASHFLRRHKKNAYPIIMPFWTGERSTGWNSKATGNICGLTRQTRSVDILFSLMEGVCWRLRAILELMRHAGFVSTVEEVVLCISGAALEHNPTWRQILADITRCVVRLEPVREVTSVGAAILVSQAYRSRTNDIVDNGCKNGFCGICSPISIPTKDNGVQFNYPTNDQQLRIFYEERQMAHETQYKRLFGQSPSVS